MDAELLAQARRGDQWAMQQIYAQSSQRVFRLALAVLGDPFSAEETMQDALHYALANLDRFDADRSAWTTWLHTITISRCRDRLRRRRLRVVPLIGSLLAPGPSPAHVAEQREITGSLHAALLRLSPKLREAVALRFLADYSYVEMGRVLGCSDRTAQSRVRLGLQRLRVLVENDPAFEELRVMN